MENETHLLVPLETDGYRLLSPVRHATAYYFVKRGFDVVFSLIILILLSPIMGVIAIMVFFDSQGPIFFIQPRVGAERLRVNGKVIWQKKLFSCIKFRTMVPNSDSTIHLAYIKALINKGYIKKTNNLARAIEIKNDIKENCDFVEIPLLGTSFFGVSWYARRFSRNK